MSEVKGALLGIVLAVSVFSVIFGIMTVAMKNSAESVQERMEQAAELEPTTSTVIAYLP